MNVEAYVLRENLIEKGDRICVALSGGPDSMALVHWLLTVKEKWQLELMATHIHHGLRSASDREEIFVREWCLNAGVPLHVVRVDLSHHRFKGMSVEEAARNARYEVFEKTALEKKAMVALGHHMNDQAETILFNLLRGSGTQGLRGMLPKRDIYIRPLLSTTRDEILAYCREMKLGYVTDESNEASDYSRNYLRNEIIPMLEERLQPRLIQRLWDTSRILKDEDDWMDSMAEETLSAIVLPSEEGIRIRRTEFSRRPPALQRRMLRRLIARVSGDLRNLTFDHIDRALGFIGHGSTGKALELPGNLVIRIDYQEAVLMRDIASETDRMMPKVLKICDLKEGEILEEGGFKASKISPENPFDYPKNKYTKWFDYDKIKTDLVLRTRMPGDWLGIGHEGHRKKLKDFFIDAKIPRPDRDRIPLLAMGSEVLWVIGHRTSDHYNICGTTRQVLEVSFTKEEQK